MVAMDFVLIIIDAVELDRLVSSVVIFKQHALKVSKNNIFKVVKLFTRAKF